MYQRLFAYTNVCESLKACRQKKVTTTALFFDVINQAPKKQQQAKSVWSDEQLMNNYAWPPIWEEEN